MALIPVHRNHTHRDRLTVLGASLSPFPEEGDPHTHCPSPPCDIYSLEFLPLSYQEKVSFHKYWEFPIS